VHTGGCFDNHIMKLLSITTGSIPGGACSVAALGREMPSKRIRGA
jgi:hypothetical protein